METSPNIVQYLQKKRKIKEGCLLRNMNSHVKNILKEKFRPVCLFSFLNKLKISVAYQNSNIFSFTKGSSLFLMVARHHVRDL